MPVLYLRLRYPSRRLPTPGLGWGCSWTTRKGMSPSTTWLMAPTFSPSLRLPSLGPSFHTSWLIQKTCPWPSAPRWKGLRGFLLPLAILLWRSLWASQGWGSAQALVLMVSPGPSLPCSPAVLRLCPPRACHCPGSSLCLFLELQTPCDRPLRCSWDGWGSRPPALETDSWACGYENFQFMPCAQVTDYKSWLSELVWG